MFCHMTVKMATGCMRYAKKGVSVFFEYDTPKIVHIRSKSIGVVNRLVQLAVIVYIIVWVMILKGGYQQVDIGIPGTTTKVKGVAYHSTNDTRIKKKVWDTQDIVVPAQENGAFFVTTNLIITDEQTQGVCPETIPGAECVSDSNCTEGTVYLLGHGITTGVCNETTQTCMVQAWCPIEHDELISKEHAVLRGTKNFTVLVKNHVYFPFYDKTRSNVLEATNKTYLQQCVYDADTNPFCPVFKLDYIVSRALDKEGKGNTYDTIAVEGAVISIKIAWNCNFDHDEKECVPSYKFDRLDKGEDSKIAKGYNYRYTHNYLDERGVERRQLVKAYGILFIINVNAKAAAFNVIPTLQNIGSGLALLGVATILCDIFVLYLHKSRVFFKGKKYENVRSADAYEYLDSGRHADDDSDDDTRMLS